jgi:hypothetical protein
MTKPIIDHSQRPETKAVDVCTRRLPRRQVAIAVTSSAFAQHRSRTQSRPDLSTGSRVARLRLMAACRGPGAASLVWLHAEGPSK